MTRSADIPAGLSPSISTPSALADTKSASSSRIGSFAHIPWLATWVLLVALTALTASLLVITTHGTRGFFLPLLILAVCLLAAFFDGSTGRIPNRLTYPAILAGLLLNALAPVLKYANLQAGLIWLSPAGMTSSLIGFSICLVLVLLSPLFANAVHGGDLKLLAAIGASLGMTQLANTLILALAIAIVYSLINLLVAGRLNEVLRMGAHRVLELIYLRQAHMPLPDDATPAGKTHIPMAIPLALGLLGAMLYEARFPNGGGPV